MPVLGDTITRAMADAAAAQLRAQADDLRSVARAARSAGAPMRSSEIQLQPLTSSQIDEAWDTLLSPVVWVPDDNCGPRAMFAAHAVNRRLHMGVTGLNDAVAAAVGIQPHTIRSVGDGYLYHGFPVVLRKGQAEPLALDPRSYDAPVPVSRMRDDLGGRAPLETWSPVQNYGYDLSTLVQPIRRLSIGRVFDMYERRLTETWEAAAAVGRVELRAGKQPPQRVA